MKCPVLDCIKCQDEIIAQLLVALDTLAFGPGPVWGRENQRLLEKCEEICAKAKECLEGER